MDMSAAATRYLLTIYRLSGEGTPVRSVEIARALEFSRASGVLILGWLGGGSGVGGVIRGLVGRGLGLGNPGGGGGGGKGVLFGHGFF